MYTIEELRKVSATPGHLKVLDKLTEWGYDELIDDFMWEWDLWVCPRYWAVQYCQKATDRYLPCGEEMYDHTGEGIDDSPVGDLITDPVPALMKRAEWVLDTHYKTVLEVEAFRAIPTDLSLQETITKLRAVPGVEHSPLVYLLDDMEATQC